MTAFYGVGMNSAEDMGIRCSRVFQLDYQAAPFLSSILRYSTNRASRLNADAPDYLSPLSEHYSGPEARNGSQDALRVV
ncbi:MAG: hypothetical protein GDA44_05060 [Prochloron sp. SP5CPC1]|nr:hypothetical protein [Candidatus Paraprochloron terpiosi SP5CPC1]